MGSGASPCEHSWALFPIDNHGKPVATVEPHVATYAAGVFCQKCWAQNSVTVVTREAKPIHRVPNDTILELRNYAVEGCQTAPPAMCGVSADVLLDMCVELMQRRLWEENSFLRETSEDESV